VDNCQSRTLHEEVLQDAVVQAIKQTICSPETEYTAIETKVLEELSAGHEAELINIEEQLKELQDKVVKSVNNNEEFDSLVDKIEQLRNRKEELTREQAQDHRNAECITELKEAI
jgi:aspartate/tyrosine/aromatic aminotransferase